ncbi:MAG: hypothetical protein HUU41_14695 [Bryobacteraceae bacterium]|nr:hypothetical protein [Bryobacterales bacterium]NUN02359.1 hypothetical protein [Bryobacteraceae bacterium]
MKRFPAAVALFFPLMAATHADWRVELPPALSEWKSEIEAASNGRLIPVRIFTDPANREIRLPTDIPAIEVLERYLRDTAFLEQFALAHALTIDYQGVEGRLFFVLLNMALAGEWEGAEEALLAHEFGHVWLNLNGYPSLAFRGTEACVALHASDIVQHELLRQDFRRRGIDYDSFWIRNLERARLELASRQKQAAQESPCRRLAGLTLWIDVRLGLTSREWAHRDEFLAALDGRYPEWRELAAELAQHIEKADLRHRRQYRETLDLAARRIQQHLRGKSYSAETKGLNL